MNINLHCQVESHDQSIIKGVCLNQQCKSNKAFCVACKIEFHRDHEKDLKYFQNFPEWITNCLKPYQNITQFQDTFLQTSNKLNYTVTLANSFRSLDLQTLSISQLEQYTQGLLILQSSEPQLTQLINKVKDDMQKLLLLFKNIESCQVQSQQQQQNFQSQSNSQSQSGIKTQQLQQQPIQNIQPQALNLTFSDKNKIAPNIKVERGGKQASGIGFVICDLVIPKDRDSILTFKYSSGFSIALGLCQKEKAIEQNYSEKLQKTGHGLYLITSASMSFSHSDEQTNNKSQKFKITPPDVITMRIRSNQKQLTWLVNNQEVLTMAIDLSKELQPFLDICGVVDIVDGQ